MCGIDPGLELAPVGILEPPEPQLGQVMADGALGPAGEIGTVAHLHGALAADDLAAHLVSVGGVDEGLHLNKHSATRG